MTELPVEHDVARRAAQTVLDLQGADGVEVVVSGSRTALTRYANSEIIQNTVRNELRAYVRVVAGERTAGATTNQLDENHLGSAAAAALEAARASRPDPDFPGLPHPDSVGRAEGLFAWDDDTARASPARRAASVTDILKAVGTDNAAGVFETGAHAYCVFSSTGIDCFDAYTRCVTTCLVDVENATGWGEASSHAIAEVDVEAVAGSSVDKAKKGAATSDADPGGYEVVLEEPAVATLIDFLSYSGFGAKAVIEGESFLSSRAGKKVAADRVTVADDVAFPGSVGIGFDFEGVPKRRVAVIDAGQATGPVTDLRTAGKLGTSSTGHFSGSTEWGPYASNVVLEPGDKSLDEMIASVERGLLVTRFHYVNILDRPATLLTGMTRDGTFAIHGGEIAGPVHNLRFTQSVLDALTSVEDVGRHTAAFAPEYGSFGSTVAPALRIGEFRFTSGTSH